mgnify:CR=1 FL=1
MTEICICVGSSCHLRGSQKLVETFKTLIEERGLGDKIALRAAFCMQRCTEKGVSVLVDGERCYGVTPEEAVAAFDRILSESQENQAKGEPGR